MKSLSVIILFVIGMLQSAKCDTIDFWHVYYNKTKKLECSQWTGCTLTVYKDSVKSNDTINIYYYMDTHCFDCYNFISVKDSPGNEIYQLKEKEDLAQDLGLKIPVKLLIASAGKKFYLYFSRSPSKFDLPFLLINIR